MVSDKLYTLKYNKFDQHRSYSIGDMAKKNLLMDSKTDRLLQGTHRMRGLNEGTQNTFSKQLKYDRLCKVSTLNVNVKKARAKNAYL